MKTFTAVFLLSLPVKDCSAASLDPGTCVAEPSSILINPCRIIKDKCTKPFFFANITVGPPTCTCECDLILNEKPVEICCDTKTVGDYSYTKVSVGAVLPSCINNCIYTRDDKPGSKYCFARGEQEVHCLDSSGAANGTANIAEATDTQLPPEANAEGESCRIVASGPFGGSASNGVNFTDRIVASNGKITQIAFRTGDWMDQIQATYGNVQSLPHGGTGGAPTGPYALQGSDIIKVEGIITRRNDAQQYVQSLTFTDQSGRVHGPFGPTYPGSKFESVQNNCFLRYLSGSKAGPAYPGYVNQLTFNWCCPK